MQIDILQIAEIIGALSLILGGIIGAYKLYDKIVDKLKALEERVEALEQGHDKDIEILNKRVEEEVERVNEENLVIIKALLGCLDGLVQLNCDGEVTKAKELIKEHLNNAAHKR